MAKWRAEGLVPPIKPKLNRKKFAKEVIEEWQDHGDVFYLVKAFGWILPGRETKQKISLEQIGALKVLKVAMECKKFENDLAAKGETKYNLNDFYKSVVAPILDL